MMKKIFLFAFVLVFPCILFAQNTNKPKTNQTSPRISSKLDKEAIDEALKHYNSLISKCNDSVYIFRTRGTLKERNNTLLEIKNLSTKVEPQSLSGADKLNNVHWRGVVALSHQYFRDYNLSTQKWRDWNQNQNISFHLTKKNGIWEDHNADFPFRQTPFDFEKIRCEKLPWNDPNSSQNQADAKEFLETHIKSFFTKCDYYYFGMFNLSLPLIVRVKDFSFEIYPTLPNKTDLEQGVEWFGEARVFLNSDSCDVLEKGCETSKWRDFVHRERYFRGISKAKGVWNLDYNQMEWFSKPTCETVNKRLGKN